MNATVIMINRNGGSFLRDAIRTCRADLESTWHSGRDFELVVVDNASTDDSISVCSHSLRDAEFPWRIVEEEKAGVNFARNAGLRVAVGELLIFTDSDLVFRPGWLCAYLEAAAHYPEEEVFAGRVIVGKVEGEIPEWLDVSGPWKRTNIVVECDLGKEMKVMPLGNGYGPVGPNMAFRRSLFARVGIFDVNFGLRPGSLVAGAEAEFFERLSRLGTCFAWVPAAVVEHPLKQHQINRRYFLARLHGVGRVSSRIARLRGSECKRLCGLTLYRVLELIRSLIAWVWIAMRGPPQRSFYQRGQVSVLLGYLHEDWLWWRRNRRKEKPSTPVGFG